MSDITKQDITRIHDRLDEMQTTSTATQVAVARIEERLNHLPEIPPRPCSFLQGHIDEHEKTKKDLNDWRTNGIRLLFDFLKMAIVAIATFVFLGRKSE